MKPLKTKVSITLDSTVVETIREMADNDDRSFSQFINLKMCIRDRLQVGMLQLSGGRRRS